MIPVAAGTGTIELSPSNGTREGFIFTNQATLPAYITFDNGTVGNSGAYTLAVVSGQSYVQPAVNGYRGQLTVFWPSGAAGYGYKREW